MSLTEHQILLAKYMHEMMEQDAKIRRLEKQLETLKKTMKWYAEIDNYHTDGVNHDAVLIDSGFKAREALRAISDLGEKK